MRWAASEEPTLPKILIVSADPPRNVRGYVEFQLGAGDLYLSDLPEDWGADDYALYQKNPPRTTRDELVKMALEEWPELAGHLDVLDISIVTEAYGTGYACLIRKRRIPPPADSRYPENYFPHVFSISRDAADGTEPIGGLAQFLGDN